MKHFYKIEHTEFLNGERVVKHISHLRYGEKTEANLYKTETYTSFEDAIEAPSGSLILKKTLFKKTPYVCSSYRIDFCIKKDNFKEYTIEEKIIESEYHGSLTTLAKILPANEFIDWLKDSQIENQLNILIN